MTDSSRKILVNKDLLEDLYLKNGTHHTAVVLSVGINTVRRWLDKHGIKRNRVIKRLYSGSKKKKFSKFKCKKYTFIKTNEMKREVSEHRYVFSQYLGRKLNQNEVVHHINLDGHDNSLDNLDLFESNKEHQRSHASLDKVVSQLIKDGIISYDKELKTYYRSK